MIWSIVIVVILFNQTPTEARTKCTDSCAIKTYSLSSNLNSSCTSASGCLVETQISVIEKDYFTEYLNFTLIGYNVGESQTLQIGLQLSKGQSATTYSCSKFGSGLTKAIVGTNGFRTQQVGSSIYLNGNLYCTWIALKALEDGLWPLDEGGKPADLVEDPGFEVSLIINQTLVPVATNSTGLPIYLRQYTKCCDYKIRGRGKYYLITKQTSNSTDFMLEAFGRTPKAASVVLKKSDAIVLTIVCNFEDYRVDSYLTLNKNNQSNLPDTLKNVKIYDKQCSWTLPGVITYASGRLETKTGLFNLNIYVDSISVYNETKISLSGFACPISSSLMIIIFSLLASNIFQ